MKRDQSTNLIFFKHLHKVVASRRKYISKKFLFSSLTERLSGAEDARGQGEAGEGEDENGCSWISSQEVCPWEDE